MQEDLKVLSRIAPDLMSDIGRRAQVLSSIESMQPVGRRALAARLNLPEREVRAAAAALKEQGLISMDAAGMQLTPQAFEVLPGAILNDCTEKLFLLTQDEQKDAHPAGITEKQEIRELLQKCSSLSEDQIHFLVLLANQMMLEKKKNKP